MLRSPLKLFQLSKTTKGQHYTSQDPFIGQKMEDADIDPAWKYINKDHMGFALMGIDLEIKGLLLGTGARAYLFISLLSLASALLQYANEAAGCTVDGYEIPLNSTLNKTNADVSEMEDCKGVVLEWLFVGGLKPSSVMSTVATIGSLMCAVTLPIIGSIVDHTNLRVSILKWSFFFLWAGNLFQGFTNADLWEASSIIQSLICAPAYIIVSTCLLAYTTELVPDMNSSLSRLNSVIRVWELVTMLGFTIISVAISIVAGFDVKGQARLAQFLSCAISLPQFLRALMTLQPRPAKAKVPEGSSLLSAGFRRVGRTVSEIFKDYPELGKFLLAVCFFESANANIVNASITLITQTLKIENPSRVLILIMILCIVGSILSKWFIKRFGMKGAMLLVLTINMMGALLIVVYVHTPERASWVYFVGVFYGIGIGATYPVQRSFMFVLAPFGQEMEMYGHFQSCSYLLGWVPGLLFTIINEAFNSLRFAMLSIMGFHLIGFFFIALIDLEAGRAASEKTMHLKWDSKAAGSLDIGAPTRRDQVAPEKGANA